MCGLDKLINKRSDCGCVHFVGSSSTSSFAMNSSNGTNSDFIKSFVQLKDVRKAVGVVLYMNGSCPDTRTPTSQTQVMSSANLIY